MTDLELGDQTIVSKMYPSISFTHSKNLQQSLILSSSLNVELPDNYRPIQSSQQSSTGQSLCPSSYKLPFYLSLLRKIFPELYQQQHVSTSNIWVCYNVIATYPILLYFISGHRIPVMNCCYIGVVIEMESQLCGWAKCGKCGKIGFEFVHLQQTNNTHKANRKQMQKSHKTEFSQHKQNNFMATPSNQKSGSMYRDNQMLFKQYKSMNQNRKQSVRKLISSNQHRHKSIKKFMGMPTDIRQFKENVSNNMKQAFHGSKMNINTTTQKSVQKHNTTQKNKESKDAINQYDDFIFREHQHSSKTSQNNKIEIGQLIIQIPAQNHSSVGSLFEENNKQKLSRQHTINLQQGRGQCSQQETQDIALDSSLKQLKQIIEELFS